MHIIVAGDHGIGKSSYINNSYIPNLKFSKISNLENQLNIINPDAVFLFYDITCYQNIEKWINYLNIFFLNIPIILIRSKVDDPQNLYNTKHIMRYIKQKKIMTKIDLSNKTLYNIERPILFVKEFILPFINNKIILYKNWNKLNIDQKLDWYPLTNGYKNNILTNLNYLNNYADLIKTYYNLN